MRSGSRRMHLRNGVRHPHRSVAWKRPKGSHESIAITFVDQRNHRIFRHRLPGSGQSGIATDYRTKPLSSSSAQEITSGIGCPLNSFASIAGWVPRL